MIKDKPAVAHPPRLGKIKLGIKEFNQKANREIPRSIDYFRADGDYAKEFHSIYGKEPKMINVMFPYDDIERCINEFYRSYKAGGLYCIGDGDTARRYSKQDDQFVDGHVCPCTALEDGDCSASIRLEFLIVGLNVLGLWALETNSYYNRGNIRGALEITSATAGKLVGVEFQMSIKMQKQHGKQFPIVSLVPNIQLPEIPAALPVKEEPKQLEPKEEDDDFGDYEDEEVEKFPEPAPVKHPISRQWPDDYSKNEILGLIDKMAADYFVGDDELRKFKVEHLGDKQLNEVNKEELAEFAVAFKKEYSIRKT